MAIHCGEIPENQRASFAAKLFGARFIFVESFIFDTASSLSPDYDGGLWSFNGLCNGGFYMAPQTDEPFDVRAENGFEGRLSPCAFGMTVCLYAFSHLSFGGDRLAEVCAEQYHLLREHMLDHPEAHSILAAID